LPFAFFFEKLIFGFTDIRKQLIANGLIFLAVFSILQFFHPAFRMVRSPLMILLGFLIALLAVVVSMMVCGRFTQTLRALRHKEASVAGADVNRGGVIGTAFMLGLNNMRRRKVRTALTCVTLVLITFVMICFTSVTADITEARYPVGRSSSNGLVRRNQNYSPLTANELANIKQIYGLSYPVTSHDWLVGIPGGQAVGNASIRIIRSVRSAGGQWVARHAVVSAAITMGPDEPQFSGIDKYLITGRGWFPRPAATPGTGATDGRVIIPDVVARALNITVAQVDSGSAVVEIRGEPFEVQGIIDSVKLTDHVGMDGRSILPYDQNTVRTRKQDASSATGGAVPEDIDRLNGSRVIIVSKCPVVAATEQNFPASCFVLLPSKPYRLRPGFPLRPAVTYREQVALVSEYLERIGAWAYYSVDNIAYYGKRTRAKSVAGLIGIVIPVLIAAMTVFNTMRGSVYERREEIYVYNAVGIAPNHIFFMFIAEACVYAVIGAMGGYILSQMTGTVLTKLHIVSGLNMDYSSIETIYVSLAIVVSVFLSTVIPARIAARLALPADEMSWTVPKAQGDCMDFNLPFTFTAHDRMAVMAYFHRWLDANGEGSAGSFFCSMPEVRVCVCGASEEVVPLIESTIWLKPYDLGVSQRLQIYLPTDPQTGEFVAAIHIERLSGSVSGWTRTVMPFLSALCKQFLNWRAVSDGQRAEMSQEARELFAHIDQTQVGVVQASCLRGEMTDGHE